MAHDLFFSYGSLDVLRGIRLSLAKSEIGVVIGPNASGKTTLLKCIAGILTPKRGKIEINGRTAFERRSPDERPVIDIPPHKRGIGYVPSDLGLFPHMTLRDNIAFPLRKRGWSQADIDHRIEELGEILSISEYLGLVPDKASRGTQQKAAIARALAGYPDLILLDEPLASIDPFTRPFIRSELKIILRKSETTTLITTHDIEDIRYFGEHVALLLKGKIIYEGPFSEEAVMIDPFLASLAGHLVIPIEVLASGESMARVKAPSGREIDVPINSQVQRGCRGHLIISSNALRVGMGDSEFSMRARIYDVISSNDHTEVLGEVEGARVRFFLSKRSPSYIKRGEDIHIEIESDDMRKNVNLTCYDT